MLSLITPNSAEQSVRWSELLCDFMLLKFCKIKKSLNPFNNCRSFIFIFLICFFIGTWWSRNIINSPSKDKVFQFTPFQIPAKSGIGSLMFDTCRFNYVKGGGGLQPKHSQFILEGGNKVFCGLVKIVSSGNVFAKEVGSKTTKESAKNAKPSGNECYFKGSKFQLYIYAFLGEFIGILIAVIIIFMVFRLRNILYYCLYCCTQH